MGQRKPQYGALFIIGLAFVPLAITCHPAFYGVAAVFIILAVAGRMRQ